MDEKLTPLRPKAGREGRATVMNKRRAGGVSPHKRVGTMSPMGMRQGRGTVSPLGEKLKFRERAKSRIDTGLRGKKSGRKDS